MSLNQTMNISLGSMKNNQYALTVVSQNIANMDVEGYSRQRVEFQTNRYTTKCENVIQTIKGMNGASISALSSYIDDGILNDLFKTNSDANYYNTVADGLAGLEDISDDLGDDGLNALLNDFFAASSNLEQFPTDMTVRNQYVLALQNVCEKFNTLSNRYDSFAQDKFNTLQTDTTRVNTLLAQLADANLSHVSNNQGPATQTKISEILTELSNYTNITTEKNENGTYSVFMGDVAVVEGTQLKYTLQASFDINSDKPLSMSLKSTENPNLVITQGVADSFKSGSMKGYVELLNGSENFTTLTDLKTSLNSAANAFAQALNDIQTKEDANGFPASITTKDGELVLEKATTPVIVSSNGGEINASNIKVNSLVSKNPYLVAAARINEDNFVDSDWTKAIGNSDNAVLITALQNKNICAMGGDENNCTLSQFLMNTATKTGMDSANIASKAETYQDIADSSATNYSNLIGVNLDEELADMIKYQRAYEASAKMFSTINDLMGTIINMV